MLLKAQSPHVPQSPDESQVPPPLLDDELDHVPLLDDELDHVPLLDELDELAHAPLLDDELELLACTEVSQPGAPPTPVSSRKASPSPCAQAVDPRDTRTSQASFEALAMGVRSMDSSEAQA